MAITNSILGNITAGNIFVSAGTNGDAITTMYFCNPNATQYTVNVFVVANGAVANTALNIVYSNVAIAAGDTLVIDMEKLVLGTGDTIQANASADNKIVATVSSLRV
jgi:hypothetical protein